MMDRNRFFMNVGSGIEALRHNKFRSILTSLGIIFGVAAVISMLAIGKGTEREIMEQLKRVGSNNIIVNPLTPEDLTDQEETSETDGENKESNNFSPGLKLQDVENIMAVLPQVTKASPEILMDAPISHGNSLVKGKMIGVQPAYFDLNNLHVYKGVPFNSNNITRPVCLINRKLANRLFQEEEAIGGLIKAHGQWLTIIGVCTDQAETGADLEFLPDQGKYQIFVPIQTILVRYENRAIPDQEDQGWWSDDEEDTKKKNYHQLDRLVLHVGNSEQVRSVASVIGRILKRRHNETIDYEIVLPELLLKQQQESKKLFNKVLGLIAGISLLVGGIGIMNIMLASVMERIKEIGIRMSVGASPIDIITQFLSESVMISLSGGIIGVILGVSLSAVVEKFLEIETIVTPFSIILSFLISALVGIGFGFYPARNAARQRPVESLRRE